MRKLAIAAALIASTMSAEAGQRNHNHNHQHQQYRHNNNNGAVFGGIVGGLILGGMLMNQPQYYHQPRYQPMCQNIFMGSYWNGYQWVQQYQTMCN